MQEDPPKVSAWNYDSQDIHKSAEFEKQQAVSWSEVAKNMNNDAKEGLTTRWYFNVPVILALLLFSTFISSLIGGYLDTFVYDSGDSICYQIKCKSKQN